MASTNNSSIRSLLENKPTTFIPSVVRMLQNDSANQTVQESFDANILNEISLGNSSSFKYDLNNSGLKSTQQLNVNWGEFSNHTFFNSAQVKTNVGFQKIIEKFPFDETRKNIEIFLDQLTGWEKYLYDQFPKIKNYIYFSGSSVGQNGTYVTVKDSVGMQFQELSRLNSGDPILNPGTGSMSFEFWMFLPNQANSNEIILQKYNNTNSHGFTLYLSNSASPTDSYISFAINSGSYVLSSSNQIIKNQWNHIGYIWDRNELQNNIKFYLNGNFVTSSNSVELDSLNFDSSDFVIGSGSAITNFVPTATFSGALDELRVWNKPRGQSDIENDLKTSIYKQNNLVLYYKFNEPSGSNSDVIIDYSGNSLHGILSDDAFENIKTRNISTSSIAGPSPMTYEMLNECPVLFPDFPDTIELKTNLLTSASLFDSVNPNLITRLVPKHYFLEGQLQDALETEEGSIVSDIISSSLPTNASLGQAQVLASLLYVWATFFDEMKLYIDAFGNLNKIDYSNEDNIPDQFLIVLAKKYGIELPPLFSGASIEQFIRGENLSEERTINDYSIQYIQNQIWRRILINLRDITTSKGTINSIKSFIRAIGIDPDNNFRIREYGGPILRQLKTSRERKSEASTMLNFISGGYIRSPFLSSSRTEPGFPSISNASSDGLFTSGSWTFEGIYKLNDSSFEAQSLVRLALESTGSSERYFIANVIATSGSGVTLYIAPNTSSNVLSMSVVNFNPMDGQDWYLSFGRKRNDQINSDVSSSYFLTISRQEFGQIVEEYTTSSWFNDYPTETNYFQVFSGSLGIYSGSFIEIGSSSVGGLVATSNLFLNSIADTRNENFNGSVSQLRFWTKALEINETREHVRNFKSIGVIKPRLNFNFETNETGSFERIRIDVSTDQEITSSDGAGSITCFDFSQNNFHFSGSDFPASKQIITPHRFFYSHLSPKIDEAVTDNKVRIRSFSDYDNILNNENFYTQLAPVYDIAPNESPNDSTKFAIDFSIVDSLNQDIVNMFATFDEFDSAIGDPTLLFSEDYPNLEILRNIYFNRLIKKINLKSFFEFYKWFDSNIGTFISQLLPMKTNFKGTNFVVEQHMLERSKFQYHTEDIYLGDNLRHGQKNPILLQLITGDFRRY